MAIACDGRSVAHSSGVAYFSTRVAANDVILLSTKNLAKEAQQLRPFVSSLLITWDSRCSSSSEPNLPLLRTPHTPPTLVMTHLPPEHAHQSGRHAIL